MSITDITFCFFFLPLALFVYYISGKKLREYVLLLLSLVFYACGSPEYVLLLIAATTLNVILGRGIADAGTRSVRRMLLFCGIVCNAGLLGYYKYTDFVLRSLARVTGSIWEPRNLLLPMGLSFFTFKAISYLADVYTGKAEAEKNPVHAALYLSFFAQIQSGPLSRYSDMRSPWKDAPLRSQKIDLFSDGVFRFMAGFNKKVLFSNVLSNITTEIFAVDAMPRSAAYAWLGAICYSMQLYYDFSGYSDMAIGITQMFGYRAPENFLYPYTTTSIAGFWRKWHVTLGSWFRDYIYIPMGGSRVNSTFRLYLNLFTVWILTGIWHGASWNFVAWGLGYFVLIAFEKTTGLPGKIRSTAGKFIYRIFVLLMINFQWVFFRAEGLREGLRYLKAMILPAALPLADERALFLLRDNLAFVVLGMIFCFPVVPWMEKICSSRKGTKVLWEILEVLVTAALFIWALSFIVAGQNNPFAYANF